MASTFSTAVYVESPPAVVFEALTNLDAAGQWMPNFVRIEKLTPGPVGPGSEWRETRKMFGKEATEHFRVTRFERPSRIDLLIDGSKGTSKRGEYAFVFEIVPERTGSNVELTGDIRMPGLRSLFARFMMGSFKKACHKDLEALKAHLESAWPANPRN
ncbi:MAG: SRPBCC family protein [Vicinamibacterales bacterium]